MRQVGVIAPLLMAAAFLVYAETNLHTRSDGIWYLVGTVVVIAAIALSIVAVAHHGSEKKKTP
jgi:hypothetical protein